MRRKSKIEKLSILQQGLIENHDGVGYGHAHTRIANALGAAGANMMMLHEFGWDCMLAVMPPRSSLIGPYKFRKDICLHTMFEARPVPAPWVDIMNRCNVIWAPTEFVREIFTEAGVTRPIFVQGYAVDSDIYPLVPRIEHEGPYKVLAWGDNLASRKNILGTIRAFHRAALPNSILEIKLNDPVMAEMVKFTGRVTFDGVAAENIKFISEYWPRKRIVEWLCEGDLGVYFSGGEGYGLQPLEMMATGMPIICAYNTGMKDYLSEEHALLVQCPTMVKSASMSKAYDMDIEVPEPDWDEAIDKMRWAYHHRAEANAMGVRGAEFTRSWTWDDVGVKALAHLVEHFGR